jgi:ABC-2 type transport system permease protein
MSRLPKSLLPVKVFAKVAIRRIFRDKTALFFTFAFPLIFLFVFGGIFGRSSGGTSFKVAVINESQTDYAKQVTNQIGSNKLYKVSQGVNSLEAAKDKMNRGQLDAAIVLPADFGAQQGDTPTGKAVIYYTQNNQQASQALTSILQAQFQGINQKFVSTATPFKV